MRRSEERLGVSVESGIDVTSKALNEMVSDFRLQDAAMVVQNFFLDKGSVRS